MVKNLPAMQETWVQSLGQEDPLEKGRRGSFSVHRSEKTPGSKYSSTSGLSPRGHLERQAEFHASTQDEA